MPTLALGNLGAVAVFVCAAALEVGGDALIRRGLRGGGGALIVLGFVVLGAYGVVVNLLDLDFSRLLGAYIGIFAVVSVVVGRVVFKDQVPAATWIGLAIVLAGSLVIHLGPVARPPRAPPAARW
jgi:drug/metabolite transporter superfamily protein YnfA